MKQLRQNWLFLVLILSCLAGHGCVAIDDAETVQRRQILIDTSGSVPEDTYQRIERHVREDARVWTQGALPGDQLVVWWLTRQDAAYPADREIITMPALRIPAHVHRLHIAKATLQQLEHALQNLPKRVKRTRLLEAIYYIASTQNKPWTLTLYSDLQEDSEQWDAALKTIGRNDEDELVGEMLKICPGVNSPPEEILLRSWPGLVGRNRAGIKEHERSRVLFRHFFEQWAPEARVSLVAIN